ncbi:MAG: SpoIIE family protein phosphatase, partial [Nitrospinae bacterium]|nr:SpoIIE family protein phosphatase [Nitrospinota bacterium]
RARNEALGALFVAREVTHGFEKDDVEAISIFAAQAALALDNARLFEEQIEKERLARELAIAKEVQHKLLPQCLPSLEGLTLAASSVSAQEVGGDYYDFVQLDDQRLAFIVGDVSGKGTSAAFYMAEMQGVFQSVSHIAPDPQDFLTHANRALANSLEKNVFISVIYGVLDLKKEEIVLARAGHCPAAMIRHLMFIPSVGRDEFLD